MPAPSALFDPGKVVWRGLTITSAAAAQICHLVAQNPGQSGVRLSVKPTGCAGMGYVLKAVTTPDDEDLLFEFQGARLWVAPEVMPFVDGTEVDYVREGLNQLFRFNNPQVRQLCGCGESFGV